MPLDAKAVITAIQRRYPTMLLFNHLRSVVLTFGFAYAAAGFDYPAGVDTWCGKAYRNTWVLQDPSPSFTKTLRGMHHLNLVAG